MKALRRFWKSRSNPVDAVSPRMWRLAPLIATLLLAVVGWRIHAVVEQALKEEFEKKLVTILEADLAALRLWLHAQLSAARVIAGDPVVGETAQELSRLATGDGSVRHRLLTSNALADLRRTLTPLVVGHGFDGFVVVDPDGTHLAAARDGLIGYRGLAEQGDFISRALQGQTLVSTPFLSLVSLSETDGLLRPRSPTMFVFTPVRGPDRAVVAALGLRIRPEGDFTRILTIARSGSSGETYAFNRNGVMISQSRFEGQLREIGLLPHQEDVSSILNVQIRDPGVNLLTSKRPEKRRGDDPLTFMAANAVQGKSGTNVEGYRDYRGVPVIGAWAWLPEYGFGVTTEVDVAEAYRPLRILRSAFFSLFAMLVLATIGVLFVSRSVLILRLRMSDAMSELQDLVQYRLEEKIGGGGLGEVYRASHILLRRPTAIKILHPGKLGEKDIQRFEREVQLSSRLTHPNTIRIYDHGITADGLFYYAMEFLNGSDLNRLVELAGPLPEGRVIHFLLQACASLREAHGLGLVHRDIKPANLIVCEHGGMYDFLVVVDFGLAKEVRQDDQGAVTNPRFAVGTPRYLAPETVRTGGAHDSRSDLYSLGAVGYFLLTGQELFDTDSVMEIIRRHLHESPMPPSARLGRQVSPDLEATLMECLEKDPEDRPQSAEELAKRLKQCQAAGSWTEEDARAWWAQHGEAMTKVVPETPDRPARSHLPVDGRIRRG